VKAQGGILRLLCTIVLGVGLSQSAPAQDKGPLKVGEAAPAFRATDQYGKEQTLPWLMGPKGAVLLFFRSADW